MNSYALKITCLGLLTGLLVGCTNGPSSTGVQTTLTRSGTGEVTAQIKASTIESAQSAAREMKNLMQEACASNHRLGFPLDKEFPGGGGLSEPLMYVLPFAVEMIEDIYVTFGEVFETATSSASSYTITLEGQCRP